MPITLGEILEAADLTPTPGIAVPPPGRQALLSLYAAVPALQPGDRKEAEQVEASTSGRIGCALKARRIYTGHSRRRMHAVSAYVLSLDGKPAAAVFAPGIIERGVLREDPACLKLAVAAAGRLAESVAIVADAQARFRMGVLLAALRPGRNGRVVQAQAGTVVPDWGDSLMRASEEVSGKVASGEAYYGPR